MAYYVIEKPIIGICLKYAPSARVVGVHHKKETADLHSKIRNVDRPFNTSVMYVVMTATYAARNYRLIA